MREKHLVLLHFEKRLSIVLVIDRLLKRVVRKMTMQKPQAMLKGLGNWKIQAKMQETLPVLLSHLLQLIFY